MQIEDSIQSNELSNTDVAANAGEGMLKDLYLVNNFTARVGVNFLVFTFEICADDATLTLRKTF